MGRYDGDRGEQFLMYGTSTPLNPRRPPAVPGHEWQEEPERSHPYGGEEESALVGDAVSVHLLPNHLQSLAVLIRTDSVSDAPEGYPSRPSRDEGEVDDDLRLLRQAGSWARDTDRFYDEVRGLYDRHRER